MNNPYLDATFLYQSMTKSATFKTSETRKDKSRSRLPRAFINRLRSKDGSTTSSTTSGSKADSPSLSEPELKIKFKMDGDKSTTTASSPPSSPLIDSRSKREKKKENNRKEKEKKENNKKEKKNAAAAAASAKKGGGGKGADKAIAELEAKLKKRKKKGKKAKKSESESESDSDTESEDGSDSESDGSDSDDDSRGYAKGKLRIRKQRSISMNSLLQDFFIKMDQQAQEPALSLVVTPPSSRSPTIGAASSDFDRQYSLTESGSGESNVLLLTRSQAAMKRARDGGMMGVSLLATDELDTESDDRSSSLSTKHSSGSGSFPITPTRRGLHGVAMGRSDDGVVLPGGGHTAGRGLASSASAAAPGKVVGLEADDDKVISRRRKKTKTKTKNEGEEEEDDEAEGFYVGTGVDMEEEDDDGEDSFGCWSDDATTSATAKTRTAAKAGVDAATDPSTNNQTDRVVADSSGTVEDQEGTNFYGGFVESGSDSSSDSDSDSDDGSIGSSDSDSSGDDEQATNYVTSGQPNGFEEVLATFAKQYLHILEDGKQLAKSDEQEELKEVLQLRTLQQLQELSLQLIKSTQPKLVDPHATPMKVTRSAPVVLAASASASTTAKSPSPKGKRRKPPNTGYGKCMDWNGTFQDILWVNEGDDRSLIDRYHALKDLAHDFNHAARTYATIIIEEAFLPDHQKTIPPIHSLGGRAGGEKYVHAGILFKFATDARGIYSGDEFAMKAAGHELKGLINFYKVHHFGICVPLMTIIDYRGFRLVAQALLPIGDDTLVYGSSDAGVNVRTDSREIEKALAAACYELNLAKHAVYPKHGPPVAMYGPGDMEGHFGLDGRYYLIDFARVFPPETPESGTKGAFLYRLLRPELVVRNGVALSSDSFSRFGGPTMDLREPHDTNTKNATDVLVEELVPQFAQWLDKQYNRAFPDYVHRSSSSFGEFLLPGSSSIASPSGDDTIGSPESAEDGLETSGSFFSVMDSDRLPGLGDMDDWASPIIQELHRMGINVRYLGLARSRCTHEVAKMVLLSEMVCRVVKNLLRERLRERMRALRTMAEEPYKEVILELFNLLLGDPTVAAERWWTYDIKTEISKRFKHALTVEELEPTYDLRRSALVPYPALFVRLQLQTAVRLTPEAINDLKNGELTSLVSADIRGQGVNGKDMNIVSTAEAIALAIRCLDGATSAREADRLLRLAIRKFEKAIGRMPGDMELINYYANFLFRKVSTFVHHGMGASGPSPGSRRTTRGRRRKSRVASDEFATWAEDKWDGGGGDGGPDDFGDFDDENHYWEERRASSNSSAAAAAAGPTQHASSTNSNANANAFVGLTSGPNPLDLSGHKLKLHRSGSNNISGTGGVNEDDVASPATATTTTTTTNVNAAAAKWAESLRWHITLLSKMLKLFKTCENFVMLNILADLCKQFATNLQQMDRDLKRAYARKLRCFAAAKQKAHQSLATSAPAGFGGGGGQSQSTSNLSSSASPSKHHHHGSGVGKSQLTGSLPGLSLPLAGGHASHASALVYERSLRRNEVLVERERDRRRDLLHSYQLQALYLTNECYTAITVIESAPLLDFVQSTMGGGGGGGLTALRPQKTTSAPSLRPSSMPMPLSLTTSATLPTLTARPASHMSAASTADRVYGAATSAAQMMTSAGSSDEYHIMKEKRSSIGMHIYPHRSASFIGKKMMPFVYFRWAELLYLRAHILEKKTRLEKQIRLNEVAEGLRSEEDEARWEKEKREEVEYLRYYSGKRYRDAFQLLDNTESRNIVQRNDDEPKSLVESNGARTASGEKKDARRWVMSAYPTNAVKENIALASIMELYRCNLEKHGRWGALSGRRSEEDPGANSKERRSGSDAKKEDDNESGGGGGEPQEKRAKTKKEKKEAKMESGGSAKKKKKHGKKRGEEAEKNEKNEAAEVVVESDRARRRREREEAEKALLMQEMKKAKDVARNKNKIQRPDDDDDDDTGDARKLRIVVDEDVLKDEPTTTIAASAEDTTTKKNEKSGGGRKAKTKAKEGGSHGGGKSSPAEAAKASGGDKEKDVNRHYGRARQAPKKAPSISAQLRSQKLKTFDDDWLPAECLSDDLFLSVVKNCPVQEVILGADAARRTHKDSVMTMLSTSRETNLSGAAATKGGKRRGGSPSSENLYIERRERRSVQVLGVDDIDIGRHSSNHHMSTRDGGGGVATSFASTRRVLTSPFASSSSATLPAPGSFATRSFSSSASAPRGSGIGGGGSASAPPAISVDALQKAAASGSFNELTHLTLKRYEEITDAQLESILRIQYTTLTSLRLESCPQLSDKTLQHLASSLFGPQLRHLSFKNCPRITNRGVLDLVKTTTSLVSLCLDGCEKISNKPIIYLAKGCPSLRHLSLMGCKKISDKSITEIANHTTNLASLRVSSERVTDASLVLMGKKLPQLYSLTMANCNITNEGLQAVCWGVAASQLTHLCFVECDKIGGKEQLLFNVVHRCPNLLYLHVKKPSPPVGKK